MGRVKRTFVLSDNLYPPECVARTIDAFSLVCEVQKNKSSENETEITISAFTDAPDETPEEFLNFLLCASIEKVLA